MHRYLIVLFLFCLVLSSRAQRVGLVFSGGGAAGLAHVGVLKALEKNKVPIDYIAGTSMGALVGGMYAMGYTPEQIEKIMLSDEFKELVSGKIDIRYTYFFRREAESASWIGLRFSIDSTLHYHLPTNIINPVNMDFGIMEYTAAASAAAGYNFDSLLVPFRCVAADIHNKQEVVFKSGDLGQALRASSAYPFYIKPVNIDNKLLFDGGLYNNFPADIMYHDFLPDVIIGCTVAAEMTPPREDDIYSQIKNMVMERTNYAAICEPGNMLVIKPKLHKVSIFDFSNSKAVIDSGYTEVVRNLETIKRLIPREADSVQLEEKRMLFRKKSKPLAISFVKIEGLEKRQAQYVSGILHMRRHLYTTQELKPMYYRLALDDHIKKMVPVAHVLPDSTYQLQIQVKADKDFYAQFGGVFSSRPVNMGFVSLRYKRLDFMSLNIEGNAYFGKFYSSAQLKSTIDFPFKLPFLVYADFTLNNFDYFNSASTFFEDTRPSYLIQFERSWNTSIAIPIGNKARIRTGYTQARIVDDYYQTQEFLSIDTADRTIFNHYSFHLHFEGDNMNRKQFANKGGQFQVSARIFSGAEENIPGSTSVSNAYFRQWHNFYRIRLISDRFLNRKGFMRIGLYGEAVISDQPLFNNYSASQLQAASFNPFPEGRTLFLTNFRANQFLAGGLKLVFPFTGRLDLRLEGYIFQPYQQILEAPDRTAYFGKPFEKRFITGSAALVYNTPLAPVSISANYYQGEKKPFSIIFTMGYLIFNRKATE